jgi:hypothetical protein
LSDSAFEAERWRYLKIAVRWPLIEWIVGHPYRGRGTGVFGKLSPVGGSHGQDARQQINTARLIILGFGSFGASGIESRHHESSVGIMWLETKFLRVTFLEIHNTEGFEPGGNFWLSCDIKEA